MGRKVGEWTSDLEGGVMAQKHQGLISAQSTRTLARIIVSWKVIDYHSDIT